MKACQLQVLKFGRLQIQAFNSSFSVKGAMAGWKGYHLTFPSVQERKS